MMDLQQGQSNGTTTILEASAAEVVRRGPWYKKPKDSWGYKLGRFLVRLLHMPNKLLWWVRHRTTNRYHVLDLRTRQYRVFFVEEEQAFDEEHAIVDWDYDERQRSVRGKALELYEWWTKGQYREQEFLACITQDLDDPFDFVSIPGTDLSEMVFTEHPRWDQYRYWSERLGAKRKRMFQLLVDIREYLWV